MVETAVRMKRRCRTCRGKGVVDAAHCQLCQQPIADDDPWWQSDDDTMACGHGEEYLVTDVVCPGCAGAGRVEQWLTPAEVKAIRRGKAARVIFVGGALIALFVVLVAAVWSDTRALTCGYWWYAIPPLFFTARHVRA